MVATDDASVPRSYLATEENFAVIKDLHSRNLIVPVVGNFAGPRPFGRSASTSGHAMRVVAAFYVSNVEQYLMREGGLDEFCASVASLPLDDSSTFIRSERGGLPPRGARRPRRLQRQLMRLWQATFSSTAAKACWRSVRGCTRLELIAELRRYFSKNALLFSTKALRLRSSPSVPVSKASKL